MSKPSDSILVDLAKHPGWKILEERAKAHHDKEVRSFAAAILRRSEPIDQLEVARARGFWAGQRWILRQVRHELTLWEKETESYQQGQENHA